MAAGEGGESHTATEMCSMEQDEGQPNRKKRQLDTQVSQSSIHSYNSAPSVQYRRQSSAYDLPTSSAAFVQPTVLTQTSLPMMTPLELATIQAQPVYIHDTQQQKQPHSVDLKEQQKQQQLKIQQQHRMYQQLHTFGAAKVDLRMNNEQQKLEQQQQQQQQLLKQQLQRQQHKQQLELEMKEQNAGVNAASSQTCTPSTTGATAPVIPSHRYALQMLQQQQQHQFPPHGSMSMPMTMTMATLSMEAQNKVNQDFEMNNLTVASSAGYDPTAFWVDFSASDQSSSSAGTINPAGLEQDALRISTVESQNQFGGTPLWM